MRAVVTNYGQSEHFPTRDGNIFFSARQTREIEISEVALVELSKFRFIKIESVFRPEKPVVVPEPVVAEVPELDPSMLQSLEELKLPALKELAKIKGIKGADGMKKQRLLDNLKES